MGKVERGNKMVKVTEKFYINASNTCYTLQEKTTIQDENSKNYGKEVFKDLGYYVSIESCLKGILKVSTREFIGKEEENTVKELLEYVKSQEELINSFKLDV